jgi:protein SCO1
MVVRVQRTHIRGRAESRCGELLGDRAGYPRKAVLSANRVLWGIVVLAGVVAGALLLVLRSPSQASSTASAPAATWAAGARPAPAFALRDQNGKGVSLAAYRGRPVLVTFMDPVCRDFCPLEAKVLNDAVASVPAAIVAVSVNLAADRRITLVRAARKWQWGREWRWAVGSGARLRPVWKRYHVAVLVTKRELVHTEAAYLIDANGNERALFLWPFTVASIVKALRNLG